MLSLLLLAACHEPDDDILTVDVHDSADSEGPGWDPRFDPLAAAIEADLDINGAHGASVAIWEDGEVVFAAGFGSARADRELPVETSTLFQIGSTTKMQTAIALLQQVEAGTLSLDTTLEEAAPELEFELDPSWDDQATMHHLISHQGGFYDWLDWSQGPDDGLLQSYSYGFFADNLWCMSPPGAMWNYSNPNFVMAGLATELADGERAWPDILAEDLYAPLGMERSTLRRDEVEADGDYALGWGFVNLNTGATGDLEALEQVPDPGWARPAGLAWSTPTEMMKIAAFLVDGDPAVLSDALREQVSSPQVDLHLSPEGASVSYGYGLFLHEGVTIGDDFHRLPYWEHGGNTLHFTSTFVVLPEERWAISILSSGYGDDFRSSVSAALTSLVELPEAEPAPEYSFDAARLDRHVGDYLDANNVGAIHIAREGEGLGISMPLLDELGYTVDPALTPVSSDIWLVYIDGTPYDLSFLGAEDEDASTYVRNRAFVGTRVQPDQAAAPPAPPSREGIDALLRLARQPLDASRLPAPGSAAAE